MATQGSGRFPWFKKKTRYLKDRKQHESHTESAFSVASSPTMTPEATVKSRLLPSKTAYAFEATKQTLIILSRIAGSAGIPLVKDVINIGLSIISTCEGINQVQEKVEELKNRVAGFLLLIAKVVNDPENKSMLKSSHHLMEELEEFKQCLITIMARLQAIAGQNMVLTTILPGANMNVIEECVNSLQDGIDRFHTARGIHVAYDLNQIQNQLEGLYNQTTTISQKVDELRALLERTQQETDLATTSVEMPPLPDVFLGRQAAVDRIAEQLASCKIEQSRVCVLGPGGIGKSSVASAVMEHAAIKERFSSKNRLWIPCVSLRSPSALLAHLARRLGTSTQVDPLEATVSVLKNDGPYLIHLDNFETPWHPIEGSQASTKRIIQSLDGIPTVSILVTMRSSFPPLRHWKSERLEVLSVDDCRQIYTTIAPESEESEELDMLLESVGRLPYGVMLLAKQAEYTGASASELLQRWKSDGLRLLSDVEGTTSGMEASIELSISSPYVTNCPGALQLLQVLSLLPAGVYRDDLSTWMKSWEVTALGTLRNACLVMTREVVTDGQKKMHLYVLPVVQSYYRQQNRIPTDIWISTYNACFEFLMTHKCVLDGPNAVGFGNSRRAIARQEANIQALLTDVLEAMNPSDPGQTHLHSQLPPLSMRSATHMESLVTFVAYQVQTRPRLDFAERVHAIISTSAKGSLGDALMTFYLCQTRYKLRCLSGLVDLLHHVRDLLLHLNRPIEACNADFCALLCHREQGASSDFSLPRAVADAQIRWKDSMSNPTVCGIVSCWTSTLYYLELPGGMKYSQVLASLVEAKALLLSQHRAVDARSCLEVIIRILLKENRPDEARVSVEEALKLTEEHDILDQGDFHYRLAQCLKASNSWGPELLEAITRSIASARKAGLPYTAALALEELGEVYVREENWAAARLAYEEALKESMKGSGISIQWIAERVRNNLMYIAAKEVNPSDDSVGFTDPIRS